MIIGLIIVTENRHPAEEVSLLPPASKSASGLKSSISNLRHKAQVGPGVGIGKAIFSI